MPFKVILRKRRNFELPVGSLLNAEGVMIVFSKPCFALCLAFV